MVCLQKDILCLDLGEPLDTLLLSTPSSLR